MRAGAWRFRRIHAEEDGMGGGGGYWEAQAGGRQPPHPRDQVRQEGPHGRRGGEARIRKFFCFFVHCTCVRYRYLLWSVEARNQRGGCV